MTIFGALGFTFMRDLTAISKPSHQPVGLRQKDPSSHEELATLTTLLYLVGINYRYKLIDGLEMIVGS